MSRQPKITPWPNSTFDLKTQWEDWGTDKHFWVYLERRAPGKFGRLKAMHGIVPLRQTKREADTLFGSARYRKAILDGAREVFVQAGVPEAQAVGFMETILKEYPCPTTDELFLEQINSPFVVMALGQRHKELSYFRTGVPEITKEDLDLVKMSLRKLDGRMKTNAAEREKFLDVVFRRGYL